MCAHRRCRITIPNDLAYCGLHDPHFKSRHVMIN
jgi:hypothetical protein